jgi:hypothetical protein
VKNGLRYPSLWIAIGGALGENQTFTAMPMTQNAMMILALLSIRN